MIFVKIFMYWYIVLHVITLLIMVYRSNQYYCGGGKDDESTPDQIEGGICEDNEGAEPSIPQTDR